MLGYLYYVIGVWCIRIPITVLKLILTTVKTRIFQPEY